MTLTVEIPENVSGELTAKFGNLSRAALEALAAKAYELDCLSLEQVRGMLGLETRWEAQALLSKLSAWPGTTVEDLNSGLGTLAKLRVQN